MRRGRMVPVIELGKEGREGKRREWKTGLMSRKAE